MIALLGVYGDAMNPGGEATVGQVDLENVEGLRLEVGDAIYTGPGGSPAIVLDDADRLYLTGNGEINLGDGGLNPGMDGDGLRLIDALGWSGMANLGVINAIDSDFFRFVDSFQDGTVNFTLGSVELADEGAWLFIFGGSTELPPVLSTVTFTEDVVLPDDGGTLIFFDGGIVEIDGDVDFSNLEELAVGFLLPGTEFELLTDSTLTLTADQVTNDFSGQGAEISLADGATNGFVHVMDLGGGFYSDANFVELVGPDPGPAGYEFQLQDVATRYDFSLSQGPFDLSHVTEDIAGWVRLELRGNSLDIDDMVAAIEAWEDANQDWEDNQDADQDALDDAIDAFEALDAAYTGADGEAEAITQAFKDLVQLIVDGPANGTGDYEMGSITITFTHVTDNELTRVFEFATAQELLDALNNKETAEGASFDFEDLYADQDRKVEFNKDLDEIFIFDGDDYPVEDPRDSLYDHYPVVLDEETDLGYFTLQLRDGVYQNPYVQTLGEQVVFTDVAQASRAIEIFDDETEGVVVNGAGTKVIYDFLDVEEAQLSANDRISISAKGYDPKLEILRIEGMAGTGITDVDFDGLKVVNLPEGPIVELGAWLVHPDGSSILDILFERSETGSDPVLIDERTYVIETQVDNRVYLEDQQALEITLTVRVPETEQAVLYGFSGTRMTKLRVIDDSIDNVGLTIDGDLVHSEFESLEIVNRAPAALQITGDLATTVSGELYLNAQAGGITIDGNIWFDDEDSTLRMRSSVEDIEIGGTVTTGDGDFTAIKTNAGTASIEAIDASEADNVTFETLVAGSNIEVGTLDLGDDVGDGGDGPQWLEATGPGTVTIDELDGTMVGDFTINVDGSTLTITDASGFDLNGNTLYLTGGSELNIGEVGTLDISDSVLDASGFSGDLYAAISVLDDDGLVKVGSGAQYYDLFGVNSFTFEFNDSDNGAVTIEEFLTTIDILDFDEFVTDLAWDGSANVNELSGKVNSNDFLIDFGDDGVEVEEVDILVDGSSIGTITLVGVNADDLVAGTFGL